MECFILRGISGSGKSTLAETLGGTICCADDFFVENGEYKFDPTKLKDAHAYCRAKFEEAVKKGERVVVANTNTQAWEFEPYKRIAEDHGYKVFCLIVENRHGGKNVHGVPENVLKNQAARFEIRL